MPGDGAGVLAKRLVRARRAVSRDDLVNRRSPEAPAPAACSLRRWSRSRRFGSMRATSPVRWSRRIQSIAVRPLSAYRSPTRKGVIQSLARVRVVERERAHVASPADSRASFSSEAITGSGGGRRPRRRGRRCRGGAGRGRGGPSNRRILTAARYRNKLSASCAASLLFSVLWLCARSRPSGRAQAPAPEARRASTTRSPRTFRATRLWPGRSGPVPFPPSRRSRPATPTPASRRSRRSCATSATCRKAPRSPRTARTAARSWTP